MKMPLHKSLLSLALTIGSMHAYAQYEDFAVLSTDPDLTKPQAIWNDKKLTVNTNHNAAIGYTMMIITDLTDNEAVVITSNYTTGREPGSEAPISWEVAGKHKFMQDHQYEANLTFYNGRDTHSPTGELTPEVGRATFSFTGMVEGYDYSDISLLEVTPPTDTFIQTQEQAVFTYKFSGPVEVYQADTPLGEAGSNIYPADCLTASEDRTEWTLNLQNNSFVRTLDSSLIINIYVRDLDGRQLKGNNGEETNSCFQFTWDCEIGATPIVAVAPADGAILNKLSVVSVKSSTGQDMSWSWTGLARIYDAEGNLVGRLVYDLDHEKSPEASFTKWVNADGLTEPISLTKEGDYRLEFTHGCFIFGERFDSTISRSLTTTFHLTGNEDPSNPAMQERLQYSEISVQPGATVEKLDEIYMIFPEKIAIAGEARAEVINEDVNEDSGETPGLVCHADITRATYVWTRVNIQLEHPVTDDGHYMIVIPKRTIGNLEFIDSDGQAGLCNPDYVLMYTVENGQGAVGTITDASRVNVYNLNGVLMMRAATSDDLRLLSKGIYLITSGGESQRRVINNQ